MCTQYRFELALNLLSYRGQTFQLNSAFVLHYQCGRTLKRALLELYELFGTTIYILLHN